MFDTVTAKFTTSLLAATLLLWLLIALPPEPVVAGTWQPTVHPENVSPGEVALVEIAPATAVQSATLHWQKRRIPLVPMPDGKKLAALLGISREAAAGQTSVELEIIDQAGRNSRYSLTLQVATKQFPEQRLTLPQRQVTPDRAAMSRHRSERQTLQKAFAEVGQERLWKAPFQLPVTGKLLSPFGVQRILNGQPCSYHSGVDQRARLGEPVATAGGGLVVLAADHFFAGKSVYIDHGMGVITMYFHLSAINVKEGERVTAGQTIGLAGATGRASGPHLHWGARVHNCKVDPLALLRALEASP